MVGTAGGISISKRFAAAVPGVVVALTPGVVLVGAAAVTKRLLESHSSRDLGRQATSLGQSPMLSRTPEGSRSTCSDDAQPGDHESKEEGRPKIRGNRWDDLARLLGSRSSREPRRYLARSSSAKVRPDVQ